MLIDHLPILPCEVLAQEFVHWFYLFFLEGGLLCCVLVVTCGILELYVGYVGLHR